MDRREFVSASAAEAVADAAPMLALQAVPGLWPRQHETRACDLNLLAQPSCW